MSAQELSSASIQAVALLDARQAGVAATKTPASPPSEAGDADGMAVQRFSDIMAAATPSRQAAPARAATAVAQVSRMPEAGVSSLFHNAAARHVELAVPSCRRADAVTQRFIDTMNSAAAVERGEGKGAADSGVEIARPADAKGGISSLFGKLSALHTDLEKRFMDPASYTSTAGMIGLQRMTGMYSIYFETLSKAVFKVVRDADTFMKSSA